jgi:hypothetical protein
MATEHGKPASDLSLGLGLADDIDVWRVALDQPPEIERRLGQFLSLDEWQQVIRSHFAADQRRRVAVHGDDVAAWSLTDIPVAAGCVALPAWRRRLAIALHRRRPAATSLDERTNAML